LSQSKDPAVKIRYALISREKDPEHCAKSLHELAANGKHPVVPRKNSQDSKMNEAQILHTLRMVIDPEIGINIVDLGLVYRVAIEDQEIQVDLTMTTPTCPLHQLIVRQAHDLLKRKFQREAQSVHISLVWDPPWNPGMISEVARRQLGWPAA
jgi:metal-sulfur cluster biosynthetic enzyme